MKVKLPILVQDQTIAAQKGMRPTENCVLDGERFFLDGPVTERLAVLDFDPKTGELAQGTRFDSQQGTYAVSPDQIEAPDFLRTNAFATVLKTIYMFEEDDTLGRPLRWGFDGPQLLVVPAAGEWANAFYEREARCLQFFYFNDKNGRRIYTSPLATTSSRTRPATRSSTGSRPTSTTRSRPSRSRCTRGSPTWSRS